MTKEIIGYRVQDSGELVEGILKFGVRPARCVENWIPIDGIHFAEVAGALLRGGNAGDPGTRIGKSQSLKVAEEEQFVPDDRAAHSPAKKILSELRLRDAAVVVAIGVGLEILVFEIFVDAAMVLVGSRLGDHKYFRAVHVSELSAGVSSDGAYFLQ